MGYVMGYTLYGICQVCKKKAIGVTDAGLLVSHTDDTVPCSGDECWGSDMLPASTYWHSPDAASLKVQSDG